jgi:hypothetical protein
VEHSPQMRARRTSLTISATLGSLGALVLAGAAQASPILWTGSQGALAASAQFDVSGTDLVITLANTSTGDVMAPADVLTSVFFNVSGSPLSLTPASAIVPAGSIVLFGTTDTGNGVGGEWAYKSGLSGGPKGRSYGISSAGLNLFGPGDRFPGNNLAGPTSVGGVDYGITSPGDNPATGNSQVTGSNPLIMNSVVFHLSGLPSGFDLTRVGGVTFQYGESLSEPSTPATVVPSPGALCALAAAGLTGLIRRRRAV